MRKLNKILLGIMLAISLALFVGCNGSTTAPTTEAPVEVSIAGDYQIDITNLGMPLIFYMRINEDNSFQLAPDRGFTQDRGHGTIGSSGNTYLMIYSTSTPDEPKTTTFEFVEGNLHFKTSLGYGTSNLPASKEDENDPEIIYYLLGLTLQYEEYFAEYAGGHTVTAMGSEVQYDYYLQLRPGREFVFVSDFMMGGEPYQYQESGYYDIVDGQVTLHLETEVVGTFDEYNNLTIGVKASEMGTRTERILQVATTAACASTYYGSYKLGGIEASTVLVLDKFGGYIFTATIDETDFVETGSFTMTGTNLFFTPASSEQTYSGTLVNFVVNATFPLTAANPDRLAVKSYCRTVQGTFTATGTDELENEYEATLVLNNDGTFSLTLVKGDETLIDKEGTFATRRIMFSQLILTASDTTVYELVISQVGLNVNFVLDEDTTIGFMLKK